MSSFVLKIIAIISMVFDHGGYVLFKSISPFNYIGRIAFPIFAFQITEGYIHTSNFKKYCIRLFVFALISQIPYSLFLSKISNNIYVLNIFFTLLFGLASIYVYDIINKSNIFSNFKNCNSLKKCLGICLAIIIGILGNIANVDYGFWGIAVIFMFYLFKNDKPAMVISFITACIIKYGIEIIKYGFNISYTFLCIFTMLSIVFILLYNKKQGKKAKYLFYAFYPVHLLIFYFLFNII